MLVKRYRNRHAKIGETIITTSNPFNLGDWEKGYEYTVIKLKHGYIVVTSDRLPSYHKEITIPDNYYEVVELIEENDLEKRHLFKAYLLEWLPIWFPIVSIGIIILGFVNGL